MHAPTHFNLILQYLFSLTHPCSYFALSRVVVLGMRSLFTLYMGVALGLILAVDLMVIYVISMFMETSAFVRLTNDLIHLRIRTVHIFSRERVKLSFN